MGKASKWFRSLLGLKKPDPPATHSHTPTPPKDKRRWSFVKSCREKDRHSHHDGANTKHTDRTPVSYGDEDHPDKHAIAVAAATAVVAEAAVAAAQAAAVVVRLTSIGRCVNTSSYADGCIGVRQEWAAVKIQAAFRGCLARKALRALKGLVRLQALVRGHIERKRTAEWLQRMQALLRVQTRACAGRAQISEFSHSCSSKSSHFNPIGPATPEKVEHNIRTKSKKFDQSSMLRRIGSRSNGMAISDEEKTQWSLTHSDSHVYEQSLDQRGSSISTGTFDDERSDRIFEIEPRKMHFTQKRKNLFHSTHLTLHSDQRGSSFTTSKDSITAHQTVIPSSSCEIQSLRQLKVCDEEDNERSFCIANNSPLFFSASSRGGSPKRSPFTPTKSDGLVNPLRGYCDRPNYMACTESSREKLRSLSAPRQRPQYERSSSTRRYSIQGSRVSALHANFTNKAYPGSGRLDKLGMPVGYRY